MYRRLLALFEPMSLAGLFTVGAVVLSFGFAPSPHGGLRWSLLAAFTACFVSHDLLPPRPWLRTLALLAQGAAALGLIWLEPRAGTAPVLLVVLVAQAAMCWSPWAVLAFALALNLGMYLALHLAGYPHQWRVVMIYASFQAFAALTAHYATTATRARDALARVNADLLATRALLAESARDAERLRLARELHDVAGHKLTALRINLRMLQADPALSGRAEIGVAEGLSAELLADIRAVVQSLRDERGLDLETALRALAAPLPRPRLQLQVARQVRVTDPVVAETVLRLVQEALTNAARHADAERVVVAIQQEEGQLLIDIEDDGQALAVLKEGNGIAGMRERLAARDGALQLGRTARGGLRLQARLPA